MVPEWLITFVNQHAYLAYLVIIALVIVEGPWVSMIGGVLLRLGFFSFIPLYVAVMAGDLIGDAMWYYIGKRFGHPFIARFGKYFSITEERVASVSRLFHRYKSSILFFSKISNGLGFAIVTLMTAGMVKIPFQRYMIVNLLGQFVWSSVLIGVGYYFGHLYLIVNDVLGRMALVALFIALIALFIGYQHYLAKKATENGQW